MIPPELAPPEVYHYCSTEGLFGILDSRSLWATDLFCLNDTSEFSYAIDLAKHCVPVNCYLRPHLKSPASLIESFRTAHTHVACFSADDDLLSQWRAYGSSGHGFALGLRPNELLQHGRNNNMFALHRVVYEKEEQEKAICDFVDTCIITRGRFLSIGDGEYWLDCLMLLLNLLMRFKHPKFSEEAEWRLFLTGVSNADLKFRVIHGSIIPYVKVDFPLSAVASVRVGPTSNTDLTGVPLKMFLEATGLSGIEPQISQIPLRGLTP